MASAVDPVSGVSVEAGASGLESLYPKFAGPSLRAAGSSFRVSSRARSRAGKIFWLGDDPKQGRLQHQDLRKDIKAGTEKIGDMLMGGAGYFALPTGRVFIKVSRDAGPVRDDVSCYPTRTCSILL